MKSQIELWLSRDPDAQTRNELEALVAAENWHEIEQRFAQRLQFGTAGLRGEVGVGPNRMNRLVIQETALGLGNYLLQQIPDAAQRGIIIGYDGRLLSKQFAYDTAAVMTALNIRVYITETVSPTPTIAFGINQLNTAAGVVVTASHNPPQDNGFKVYWENGAQIIAPHDGGIAAAIDVAAQSEIPLCDLTDAGEKGLLSWLGQSFFDEYQQMVLENLHQPASQDKFAVAYTPMHGVGANIAEALAEEQGLCQLYSVPSQREPDGTFPTVTFPNPEEPGAMDRVIQLAQEIGADYAIANDPDADRFAIAIRTPLNQFRMLTGDQVGLLLADHILTTSKASGWVGNTIVSSRMLEKIANHHQANYYQTLTGFKWLANVAMDKRSEALPFLFAYEEALGYAIGQHVWDKDGLNAMVNFIELIHLLRSNNQTVWDKLAQLYQQHGLHFTTQKSIRLAPGTPAVGDKLRSDPPAKIAGLQVVTHMDYKTGHATSIDGSVSEISLPKSDVLVYLLEDDSRIIVRPSGTEPKLKCYYERITPLASADQFWTAQTEAQQQMEQLIERHQIDLNNLLNG